MSLYSNPYRTPWPRRDAHDGQNSDVRANDLAFSLHCNLCSTVMLMQIMLYSGDGQRVTGVCWASTAGVPPAMKRIALLPQCLALSAVSGLLP